MNKAIEQIKKSFPSILVSILDLPEEHSLNDMLVNYSAEGIYKLLNEPRKLIDSTTDSIQNIAINRLIMASAENVEGEKKLIIHHEHKIAFEGKDGMYYVLGQVPTDLGLMKVTLSFEQKETQKKHRIKIDLFEPQEIIEFSRQVCDVEQLDTEQMQIELFQLADHLETHRDKQLAQSWTQQNKRILVQLSPEKEQEALEFLSQPNLINEIDKHIEASGIVGETTNRKMLYVIASTYKMPNQLHALVQGTSGSGKTHLINAIASLMPPEDTLNMTRVTSKSFYHYQKDELVNKLILIQDMDGLDDEAKFAFREMQSAGQVSSSTTYKDKSGNLLSTVKTVNANFASMVATTHAEIYYDNMSRSIVLGVDESTKQTQLIIQEQNKKTAGLIDEQKTKQAKELLQNCIRTLKPYEVVNRYADKIQLPVEAKMLRRLNNHYQSFVAQITILHQYQRQKDEQGRLIATVEDLELACEILFDAIMWKIDELDSSLRQVFEQVKEYVQKQTQKNKHQFTTREIRQQFNLSKSQATRYMEELRKLEYIQVADGTANRGFKYQIAYWDNMITTRQKVKEGLLKQLRELK